jgi:tetratricopeptide (TPR) repeat protein
MITGIENSVEREPRRKQITPLLLIVAVVLLVAVGCKSGKEIQAVKPAVPTSDTVTSAMMELSGMYIEGSREKILGNFQRATEIFQACLKVNPGHHPSHFQLADIHHITGDYTEALHWCEMAIRHDPANIWYKVLYGDVLLKLGRYPEAVKVYEEINRLKPGKRMWFEARAFAQIHAGDPKGAAITYQGILDRFGFDEAIFLKMLGIYEKQHNYRQMETSLKWLVQKFPYETRYLGMLASWYHGRNNASKALPLWQEILRLEPGNGEVHFEMANYYRSKGEDAKAFNALLEAFSSPNLSIDAKVVVMLSYYNLSEQYPALIPEAYQLLDLMVTRHPENPKGWSMYGDFLFRDRNYEEALLKMRRVTQLDSSKYLVWEQLLQCAFVLHDYTTLVQEGARAFRIFPDRALMALYYGTGLLYGNQTDDALKTLRQGQFFVGFNDTLDAAYLHAMARCYEANGEMERAWEYYRKANSKYPASGVIASDYQRIKLIHSAHDHPGGAYSVPWLDPGSDPLKQIAGLWSRLGGPSADQVGNDLKKIVDAHPDDYQVMELSGALYSWLGMPDEARKVWSRGIILSKGNLFLQQKTDKLNP